MTLTRDDIITEYRRRIEQDMRSKLSKNERTALAESFIDMLGYCQTEDDCRVLCKAEIALLEEGYPQASIANQYLPQWRKAIAAAIEDGQLPRMELKPNEFGKSYEHWALDHLRYSNQVYRALKQKTTAGNNRKQDNLQPVRADRFIATARKLLERDNALEQAAGLLALTGRRFSEIVTFGEFWETEHPYAIAFRGQLKKGLLDVRDAETFLIATLIEGHNIINALEQFRSHSRIIELQGLEPDDINSRLNTSVRHHIKREFQDTGLVPVLQGEKSVSAHNLRGVYGTIAIRFFCPPQQNPHRFVQAHLGHIIGERELANRKNAGATEHYFHYYIVGAQGQMLGDRGILLEQVGSLPTVPVRKAAMQDKTIQDKAIQDKAMQDKATANEFKSDKRKIEAQVFDEPDLDALDLDELDLEESVDESVLDEPIDSIESAKSVELADDPVETTALDGPTAIEVPIVEAIPQKTMPKSKKAKNQRRARTSVPADLMDELKAIATVKFELGREPTNGEVMAATVDFLREDNAPKMSESINAMGSTMSWFTSEIDRLRAAAEDLEQELITVNTEKDQIMDELDRVKEQGQDGGQELDTLREENKTLRGELQQFHQLKQLLGGGNGSTPPPTAASAPETISASEPVQLSVSDPPLATTANPAQTNSARVPQKRVQNMSVALDAIDKAITQILEWNDNEERSSDEKWYVSFPVLQDLLRGSGYTASQPRVKKAIDQRRAEIDNHHARHGLGRRHNTRHQQPITKMMTLS